MINIITVCTFNIYWCLKYNHLEICCFKTDVFHSKKIFKLYFCQSNCSNFFRILHSFILDLVTVLWHIITIITTTFSMPLTWQFKFWMQNIAHGNGIGNLRPVKILLFCRLVLRLTDRWHWRLSTSYSLMRLTSGIIYCITILNSHQVTQGMYYITLSKGDLSGSSGSITEGRLSCYTLSYFTINMFVRCWLELRLNLIYSIHNESPSSRHFIVVFQCKDVLYSPLILSFI